MSRLKYNCTGCTEIANFRTTMMWVKFDMQTIELCTIRFHVPSAFKMLQDIKAKNDTFYVGTDYDRKFMLTAIRIQTELHSDLTIDPNLSLISGVHFDITMLNRHARRNQVLAHARD